MNDELGDQPLRGAASELDDVREFLRSSLPFHELDAAALDEAVRALRIAYHRQGERFDENAAKDGLRILRSGAVDIRDGDNKLLDRLGEGESFHIGGLNAERGAVRALV
ncbi:MAG: cyclic nucleotide-binding/CBS domain-containing protein, partial [Pseudomonadota bacterium]